MKKSFILLLSILLLGACKDDSNSVKQEVNVPAKPTITVPTFDADSAYQYIADQVAIGPRVPNTPGQIACKDYLVTFFKQLKCEVTVQEGEVTAWNKSRLPMYNIIASFYPERTNRLILSAHWDTRPYADRAHTDQDVPIEGANDGGSGVGVLMEIARQLNTIELERGIDIVLFDVEDYGNPHTEKSLIPDPYCLGSQYWAAKPHKKGYFASEGILLDMVGAKDARFCMEATSMRYAPTTMQKVWNKGVELGYGKHFCFEQTSGITDDHLYVNRIMGIPMIDIIQFDDHTYSGFGAYWHTHDDNMTVIDKNTLKAIGQTVLAYACE